MSEKYHISKGGKARKCRAETPATCKATPKDSTQHFDTREAAQAHYEKANQASLFKIQKKLVEITENSPNKVVKYEPKATILGKNAKQAEKEFSEFVESTDRLSEDFFNRSIDEINRGSGSVDYLTSQGEIVDVYVNKIRQRILLMQDKIEASPNKDYSLMRKTSESAVRIEAAYLGAAIDLVSKNLLNRHEKKQKNPFSKIFGTSKRSSKLEDNEKELLNSSLLEYMETLNHESYNAETKKIMFESNFRVLEDKPHIMAYLSKAKILK